MNFFFITHRLPLFNDDHPGIMTRSQDIPSRDPQKQLEQLDRVLFRIEQAGDVLSVDNHSEYKTATLNNQLTSFDEFTNR